MVEKDKSFMDYFDNIVAFIKQKLPESMYNMVLIIAIAYIISHIISIFNIHINYSF